MEEKREEGKENLLEAEINTGNRRQETKYTR